MYQQQHYIIPPLPPHVGTPLTYSGQYYLPPPPPLPPPPINGWYPPIIPPPPLPSMFPSSHNNSVYHSPKRGGRGSKRHKRGRSIPPNHSSSTSNTSQLFSCHTCNRDYKSDETYQSHLQAHVKCDQCDFKALPKLVREHSVLHSLPDFLVFSTPEDTQKWRTERKKNYPTVANVAKKKQQESEKKDRRQILDTPLYRYVNKLIGENESGGSCYNRGGKGRGRGGRRGSGRGGGRRWSQQRETSHYENNHKESEQDQSNDDKQLISENRKRSNDSTEKMQNRKRLKNIDVFPKKPTLLEKLLCNEVRREHNIILQCVHHIVRNNFWDLHQNVT